MTRTDQETLAKMEHWLHAAVIGLNLCPFAAPLVRQGGLSITISHATSVSRLLADIDAQFQLLTPNQPAGEAPESVLIVVPDMLLQFSDYNAFLDAADTLLSARGLEGRLQIASFHPDYRFDGVAADDPSNNTNRAPFPLLHLLREDSISRVTGDDERVGSQVVQRNLQTMRDLGNHGWQSLMEGRIKAPD